MIRVGEGTSPEPDKIPTAQTTDSGKANENNSPSIQQLKAFQAMADNSPRAQQFKAYQEMVDNSPRVQQFKAYQEMADNYLQGDDKIKFVKGVDNSKVTEGVISVLKRLSDKVGLKNIIVTGTARTARRQAEVMYAKLKLGEPDVYKTPGRRVQKVYNDMVKDGETDKKKIIDAMYDKILEEGSSNVSRHCADYTQSITLDLGYGNNPMTDEQEKKFINQINILKKQGIVIDFQYKGNNKYEKAYHIVFSVSKSEELLKQVNLTNTEANKVNPKVFENDPEEASKSNVAPLNQNNYNPNDINSWSDFTRELNRWINW